MNVKGHRNRTEPDTTFLKQIILSLIKSLEI